MRHPFARGTGSALLEHAVDLFKRETFGFGDEHIGVDEADCAKGAPKEENFRSEVGFVGTDEVGGNNSDDLDSFSVSLPRYFCLSKVTYAVP